MKDYKLLLAGLILPLLIIIIGIFTWLWSSNRKNMDPLPITTNSDANGQSPTNTAEEANTIASNTLYVQAEDKLQTPLNDVIVRFKSRYPNVQVLARYVSTKALLTLPDASLSDSEPSPFIVNIDMIIADDRLTEARLSPLQVQLNIAQDERNQSVKSANDTDNETAAPDLKTETDNNEARNLASFKYAIKGKRAVGGVILTDNPIAISFRNFLLSSAGQDILKKHDYDNIDGYRNSMDDLFNPTSHAKSAVDESSVQVADALSNGK